VSPYEEKGNAAVAAAAAGIKAPIFEPDLRETSARPVADVASGFEEGIRRAHIT
jgi:hypothetical protein